MLLLLLFVVVVVVVVGGGGGGGGGTCSVVYLRFFMYHLGFRRHMLGNGCVHPNYRLTVFGNRTPLVTSRIPIPSFQGRPSFREIVVYLRGEKFPENTAKDATLGTAHMQPARYKPFGHHGVM